MYCSVLNFTGVIVGWPSLGRSCVRIAKGRRAATEGRPTITPVETLFRLYKLQLSGKQDEIVDTIQIPRIEKTDLNLPFPLRRLRDFHLRP